MAFYRCEYRILLGLLGISVIHCAQKLEEDSLDWVNEFANHPEHWNEYRRSTHHGVGKTSCNSDEGRAVCVKKSDCNMEIAKVDPTSFELRRGECHYLQQCCPLHKVRSNRRSGSGSISSSPPGCGWSNPGANVFRYNVETYADYGEFPWMVALLKKSRRSRWSKVYIGGGSLIHEKVVMTVAHKAYGVNPHKTICRAGEWDTRTDQEMYDYQEQSVAKIIIHNDYTRSNVHNDIALLIMSEPFDLGNAPHIGLACIGQGQPAPRTQCYSMGWGKEFGKSKKFAVILKKIQMPIVSPQTCQESLRTKTDMDPRFDLHSSFLCAGGEDGADSCAGDGGSPLVCSIGKENDTPRFAVFGMVAFGSVGCGEKDIPGVYVNVPNMSRWVDDQILLEGLDKPYVY